MRSGSLPSRKGRRYFVMAVSTTRARWVKVAQPRPYSPGSLVCTLTTTRRIFAGAVSTALTSVIFSGGSPRGASGLAGGPSGAGRPARAGAGTGGPALLHFFRQRVLPEADKQRVRTLIKQLGDDSFRVREKASAALVSLGPGVAPMLRQPGATTDPEVLCRAEECLIAVEKTS